MTVSEANVPLCWNTLNITPGRFWPRSTRLGSSWRVPALLCAVLGVVFCMMLLLGLCVSWCVIAFTPLETKVSSARRGSFLSSAHSKSISPAPSAASLANASHPSPAEGSEPAQRGCTAPQTPGSPSTAPLPLSPLPHTMHMAKTLRKALGERCRSLPGVAWCSSTSVSEALAASWVFSPGSTR